MSINLFFDTVLADERENDEATTQTLRLVTGQTTQVDPCRLPYRMLVEIRERALQLFSSINGSPTDPVNAAMLAGLDVHSRRTARYANLLAHRLMALSGDRGELLGLSAEVLAIATLFHDVGKTGVSARIVGKPEVLDAREWAIMKIHPALGAQLIERVASGYASSPARQAIGDAAMFHHERWDGSGYPNGLAGTAIPLSARTTAVIDTYDAITHARSYQAQRSHAEAVQIILDGAGSIFDPAIVDAFHSVANELPKVETESLDIKF